jgi:hypothetical protein
LRGISRPALDGHDHERTVEEPVVVGVRVLLGLLEGIAAQVEEQRHTQLNEGFAPDAEGFTAVFQEDGLPVLIAEQRRSGRRR